MKKLYYVKTETGRRWEIFGGNYLVYANSEDEIRIMTFYDEKIIRICPIEDLNFKNDVFIINRSIEE